MTKKRFLSLLMLLALISGMVPASAATLVDGNAKRDITIRPAGENTVEEGRSPTTGLYLADYEQIAGFAGLAITGRYMPMLVQIDNSGGGVGDYAPWGAAWADIVYETPLRSTGATRISFLFSDLIPDAVGPVRSARVGHVWLRQEWDCGFMYYGGQTKEGSSIQDEFRKYGAKMGVVLFSGTDGLSKKWKKLYTHRKGTVSPHDQSGNAAGISALIPADHVAPNHAFRFTDATPTGGDSAATIVVDWGMVGYSSTLLYDVESNSYYRFMHRDSGNLSPYVDKDTLQQLAFANVIVQYTTTTYNGSSDAPVTEMVGGGNCEIFMGGRHYAGVWQRPSMSSRTVYYGEDGSEVELQRGKTLIIVLPPERSLSYE